MVNHEARFVFFFLLPMCVLFFYVLYLALKETKEEKEKRELLLKQLQTEWDYNFNNYHKSLSNGNRPSSLYYGRMCGFSESRITNDLLCLLNNLK